MKKRILTFLMMLFVMAFASVAVAAIPTLSRDRYLVTKIYSSSSIPVFTDSNLNVQGTAVPKRAYKASIAPNDDVYVFNYSGNSWAYVSYPTSSGRKEGYIRMSDLTPNNHWQDPQHARKSMSTYTRPGGAKYGSISNGDTVHTIAATNYRFQVVYPINNGRQYKMAWVTDADYFAYIAPSSSPSPAPAPTPAPAPSGNVRDRLLYAVFKKSGGRISCDFDGYKNTSGRHEGIDLVLSHKAPVYAVVSGTITRAGGSYNTVAIYDKNNNKTVVYLHFDSVAVRQGQYVNKGDLIGYQGKNGAPQGSHVHIEVRDGQKTAAAKSVNDPVLNNPNPYDYLNKVL